MTFQGVPPASTERRRFLTRALPGLAGLATTWLLADSGVARAGVHFPPKAKRAIWLFMAGAPSQLDLFDYKPELADRYDQDLPESVRQGQRLAQAAYQTRFPIAPSRFAFSRAGQSGAWVSELLPYTARIVDDIAIVKTVNTESVNHDPAILAMNTGNALPGKPSVGAWLSFGLDDIDQNVPSFAVMTSRMSRSGDAQALTGSLWGSGFLPARHAAVSIRSSGDPVLYLPNPPGIDVTVRRRMLDAVGALNAEASRRNADPSAAERTAQYELAFRMQSSVPALVDLSVESPATLDLYGPDATTPGTFAHNCVLARKMMEQGVRFVQIYQRGWDAHVGLPSNHVDQCRDMDQACYGLVTDLKQRGLLDDTLVVWGGEFGRTVFCQGPLTRDDYGRDHHPRCFTMWLAGGGIRPGIVHGETDDFGYNVVSGSVPLADLHATILHQFGFDHRLLTFRHAGLDQKLTGTGETAAVVEDLLA
ncbi:MAG TPA: DUF1501 domain-containing protein [Polyangiaceae bacterium]